MSRTAQGARKQTRQRGNRRCEYCHRPEGFGFFGHQVDHVIALKHGGSDDLDNLAWACFYCNIGKGSDLSSFDRETNTIVLLFNPRTQQWEDHFRLEDARIIGITATGRVTARLLRMNSPNQIEIRERLIREERW